MENTIPNLRHLGAFREVARLHSVSKASQTVYLSQPAITQAISKLETQLNARLFERRADGMFTTEPGRLFLDRVNRALDLVAAGAREATRVSGRRNSRGGASFEQLLTTAQLRALAAVSDAGNFSIAARAVGVSQPSLHRAARDLERLSGMSLFVKTAQGIDLTAAAQALVQNVKLAFAELRQGFTEVEEWRGVETGTIVVGTMPLARSYVVPAAINALSREQADFHISAVDGPYADLLHGLRHGEIDVLIGALRDPPPIDDVVQEPLFDDGLEVVGRAGHPLAARSKVTPEDLAAYPWVVPRAGTPTRDHFEALFSGNKGVRPSNVIESSSLILIRGLLLDSDRLTLISGHQVRLEVGLGLLKPLAADLHDTRRPIGLTLRRDWRPTGVQARFLDAVREAGHAATRG